MFGHYKSSAHVKDGRLVLSMPDAETPVVWVMDLNDATTSVLRLESDKQGFYVIKKHGGKTAETIAVYRNRKPAVRALDKSTKALDSARSLRGQGGGSSRLTNILLGILFVWFVLFRLGNLDLCLIQLAIYPFIKDDIAAMQAQQAAAQEQQSATQPDAVGVPLSADDALQVDQNRNNAENPFGAMMGQ